jgi:hypothetical protein
MSKKGKNGGPPKDPTLFDYEKAKAGKEGGMEQVLKHEDVFKIRIAQFIDNLAHDWEGPFEDIRAMYIVSKDYIRPHHQNCWGAVTNAAIKRGTIVKTGEMVPPTGIKSHGRPVNVLRRV